jgi:hypothetical protein
MVICITIFYILIPQPQLTFGSVTSPETTGNFNASDHPNCGSDLLLHQKWESEEKHCNFGKVAPIFDPENKDRELEQCLLSW